ncbi:hypothetical protein [Paenibacillus tyrfis]|uniref:hypothetical protein n=1 Tax=Paenibacillus tyrfis TaxID=1501230 RepID=UPI00209F96A0|nr:hypothetical protein [Paenibacillus tyrfis]MCP1311020.1 hypothetical protein [Paenibacillus tyrfis]
MDTAKAQLLNSQLSNLRVQLPFAKLSVCVRDWRRLDSGRQRAVPSGAGRVYVHPRGTEQSFSVTEGTPSTMYWCHFGSNIRLGRMFKLLGISNLVKAEDPAFPSPNEKNKTETCVCVGVLNLYL